MNELALFAGIGGGILGTQLLGHRCICAVENDPHAQSVLLARQNNGMLPTFPIWDDVTTFDGKPWRGIVDIVSGGFPCQDISSSGQGAGITGEQSGLWKHMFRIIGDIQPKFAFIENSPLLRTRGLGTILKDLASIGYDAEWCVVGAWEIGAPHKRNRMWILAYPKQVGLHPAENISLLESKGESKLCAIQSRNYRDSWGKDKSGVVRMAYGDPDRVDRLARAGNAQVPGVVRLAFEILMQRIAESA
jgi:DNA (cytosine-5)-methyltransferase 1